MTALSRRGLLTALAIGVAGCSGRSGDGGGGYMTPTADDAGLELTSPAFTAGASIPTVHTCDGENTSPPLSVSGVADDAASLALVVDDPDAPRETPFVHWLLWNLPPDTEEIPAAVPRGEAADGLDGAVQGTNSNGDVGYSGPCPPGGDGTHTYRFILTALDTTLDLEAGVKRPSLSEAMVDAALQRVILTGTYER